MPNLPFTSPTARAALRALGALPFAMPLTLAAAGIAAAQTPPPPPPPGGHACMPATVSVNGEGQSFIAPDMASITVGVTTQNPTAAEAMTANSTTQTAVIEALTGQGIERRDIQTSSLSLSPVQDYPDGQAPVLRGYRAENVVTVKIRDLDKLGATLDALVGAGANEIRNIDFIREDMRDAQDEARKLAVEDARHRAETIAAAAGQELGPLIEIGDSVNSGPRPPQPMMARAAMASDSVPVEAGELSVNQQISAVWALTGGACVPGGPRSDGPKPPPPPPPADGAAPPAPAPVDAGPGMGAGAPPEAPPAPTN